MKKKPEIFLSYAREDRARVEDIYDSLRAEGFRPWIDVRDIRAGAKWSSEIGKAIRQADLLLVFISNNSVSKRGYFQRELKIALSVLSERPESEIFLIPVRLDESALPESLSHIQYIDLFEKGGWHKLLYAIGEEFGRRSLSQAGIHELKEEIQREAELHDESRKPHVFIAMPFKVEMEDVYHYGIKQSVEANELRCDRVDKEAFTGDILEQIKKRIESSVAVIAELSGENPNVHVELGYAWGKEIPTILLLREGEELCFDLRGQRCLVYTSIIGLERNLTKELADLIANGGILSNKATDDQ